MSIFLETQKYYIDLENRENSVTTTLNINPVTCDIIASFTSLEYAGTCCLSCNINKIKSKGFIDGMRLYRALDEITDYITMMEKL